MILHEYAINIDEPPTFKHGQGDGALHQLGDCVVACVGFYDLVGAAAEEKNFVMTSSKRAVLKGFCSTFGEKSPLNEL